MSLARIAGVRFACELTVDPAAVWHSIKRRSASLVRILVE